MSLISRSRSMVYWMAALISVLLSVCFQQRSVLINPDAICYLQSADILNQGLKSVMTLCDQSHWPFYSVFIGTISKLLTISSLQAAIIINSLFSLLTVLIFMRLVACFDQSKQILILSALTILCAHQLNAFQVEIIRDHGFWFFYLTSIVFLLAFFKKLQFKYVVAWTMSLGLATLFRIEGIIFLVLIPWVAWFLTPSYGITRSKAFIFLLTPLCLGIVLLLIGLSIYPEFSLGRLNELYAQLSWTHIYQNLIQHYQQLADVLGQEVLGPSAGERYSIYFLLLIVWYVTIVVSALSLLYSILFVYALFKKVWHEKSSGQYVLWGYIAINVAMTFLFLIENQFVSKRYVMALALTMMVWIPFALNHLIERFKAHRIGLALLLTVIVLNGLTPLLHLGHSKEYIRQAGEWLDQHATDQSKIYSNDYQIMYYSHHFGNQLFVKRREFANVSVLYKGQWRQFDYIAIRFNPESLKKESALFNALSAWPYITFKSQHGNDEVRIYQRSQS